MAPTFALGGKDKPKTKPPPPKLPLFLYFHDVSEEDLNRVAAAPTKAEVRQLLKEFLTIDQDEGYRTEILADLHYHNYAFSVSRGFSVDKISTFLSIMKHVLEEAVERKLPVDEAFEVFKEWLLKHSVERPPQSVGVFAYDDTQAIMDYAHGSFFRHYKLYMYVYMTRCDINFCMEGGQGGFVPPQRPLPLLIANEVDPKAQKEFAHIFRPTEAELAEEAMRKLREGKGDGKEDRAALIKRKVDEGVKKLMENFEGKLKEQDERFRAQLPA
jgi:hypothetical protein